jgi:hypothetical protein
VFTRVEAHVSARIDSGDLQAGARLLPADIGPALDIDPRVVTEALGSLRDRRAGLGGIGLIVVGARPFKLTRVGELPLSPRAERVQRFLIAAIEEGDLGAGDSISRVVTSGLAEAGSAIRKALGELRGAALGGSGLAVDGGGQGRSYVLAHEEDNSRRESRW